MISGDGKNQRGVIAGPFFNVFRLLQPIFGMEIPLLGKMTQKSHYRPTVFLSFIHLSRKSDRLRSVRGTRFLILLRKINERVDHAIACYASGSGSRRHLVSRLTQYAETLKTPFFGALVDYAEQGNQLWTCPGHNGGIFYSRSPIGRIFMEHLGEAIFRDDLDNSITELGDLLTHEGPALAAQKEAAAIFGAEKTYFVLNGTSASNKIALSALIADGDLVLFDRNNHKAAPRGSWPRRVRLLPSGRSGRGRNTDAIGPTSGPTRVCPSSKLLTCAASPDFQMKINSCWLR
jgi:hypothetical protein